MRKLLLSIVTTLAFLGLSGCTPSTSPVGTSTIKPTATTGEVQESQAEEEVTTSFYPECDTEAHEPAFGDSGPQMKEIDCPTDRTSVIEALPAADILNNLEPCELVEVSDDRRMYPTGYTTGFPRYSGPERLPDGKHTIAVIPVNYIDFKEDSDPMSFILPATEKMGEWYETYTRGNVTIEWRVYPDWIQIPYTSDNFLQSEAQQNLSQWGEENMAVIDRFWTAAIAAADPLVDFSGVSMVYFVLPRENSLNAEFNLWPVGDAAKSYNTDEGVINRGFVPGGYQYSDVGNLWTFWTHETLHYFMLPDLYWHDQNSVKHTQYFLQSPGGGFDILMNQDGSSRDLSMWLMWLAGWAMDGEIECQSEATFVDGSYSLAPVSQSGSDLKAVILKLSDSKALVVESRRDTDFNFKPSNPDIVKRSKSGVFVYLVDTALGNGQGAITALAPEGRTLIYMPMSDNGGTPHLDYVLYEGNSIEAGGYRITVNAATEFSDTVSIEKLADWQEGSQTSLVCYTKENRDLTEPLDVTCPIDFPK